VTVSGGRVSSWLDRSGAGHHVSQSSVPKQPSIAFGWAAGHEAICFGGAEYLRSEPFASSVPQPLSLIVIAQTSSTAKQVIVDGLAATARTVVGLQSGASPVPEIDAGNTISGGAVAVGERFVLSALFDNPGSRLWKGGTEIASGFTGAGSLGGLTLGAHYTETSYLLGGCIAEIIGYSRALDNAERSGIDAYAIARYGL
jgi:hypothetical protein